MIIYTLHTAHSDKPCKFKHIGTRYNMMLIAPEMLLCFQGATDPKSSRFPFESANSAFCTSTKAKLPNDLPIYRSDLLDFPYYGCFNVFLKFSKSKLSLRNVALESFIDLIFVDLLCFWTMSLVPSIKMNKNDPIWYSYRYVESLPDLTGGLFARAHARSPSQSLSPSKGQSDLSTYLPTQLTHQPANYRPIRYNQHPSFKLNIWHLKNWCQLCLIFHKQYNSDLFGEVHRKSRFLGWSSWQANKWPQLLPARVHLPTEASNHLAKSLHVPLKLWGNFQTTSQNPALAMRFSKTSRKIWHFLNEIKCFSWSLTHISAQVWKV